MGINRKVKWAGFLLLAGFVTGILSVAPAIDSETYLTEAAANSKEVLSAAVFQFAMALAFLGVPVLLYPIICRFGPNLSIGFLSFRIIAVTLSISGTILLLSVLALSQVFNDNPSQAVDAVKTLGGILKATRDYVNHVFMILVLAAGNFMFYVLFFKSKLIPAWLSVWGITGAFLSSIASLLVLFQTVEIITAEYLVLNAPAGIQELVFGVWLIVKGFDRERFQISKPV